MSANEEITEWLNRQHEWLREAAFRLLSKGRLDEDDVNELVAFAKAPEPKPKDKIPRSFPTIGGGPATSADLRLESIGPVVGIDALNPKKPLEFGTGNLSVVYGSNGAGKSGYTRIISKACGKAHSVELKSNVYLATPERQECTFGYSHGGQRKQAVWLANTDPLEDLKPIDVFDTECGRLYLEKDNELSYEPPELALFSRLVDACKRVEAALSAEQEKIGSKLPGIPPQYASTEVAKAYMRLSKDTTPSMIVELITWADEDDADLKGQRERLNNENPAGAAKKKREEKKQIEAIRDALQVAVDALGESAIEEISSLKEDAVAKRKAAQEGAAAIGDATKLNGVGSRTWKAMWEAARSYSTTEGYPEQEFPRTDDEARCVLCQQDLNEDARRRLMGFDEFVKGTLEKEATAAEDLLAENLKNLPIRPSPQVLATACQAAGLEDDLQKAIENAWETLEPLLAPLRKASLPERATSEIEEVQPNLARLNELSTKVEDSAKELEADAQNTDREEAVVRLTELEGRKWVADQSAAIKAEVDRLKKWAEYDDWKRKMATTGISTTAGKLSKILITDAYVRRFNNELEKLGAHKIRVGLVKTPTSQAKSRHGIRLQDAKNGKATVSSVLSEGERRVVALAAFLADVTGRSAKSPFVFDDPISSLDQNFEEKVIVRLVELSKERQVLVFTHRLSLLGIMTDLAGSELHDVHIGREPWGSGEPSGVPVFAKNPEGALKNLKNERLKRAE